MDLHFFGVGYWKVISVLWWRHVCLIFHELCSFALLSLRLKELHIGAGNPWASGIGSRLCLRGAGPTCRTASGSTAGAKVCRPASGGMEGRASCQVPEWAGLPQTEAEHGWGWVTGLFQDS